jgi:hypothetical protein
MEYYSLISIFETNATSNMNLLAYSKEKISMLIAKSTSLSFL